MQEALTRLRQLRRPRLLIRAARAGLPDYRREVHLGRRSARRRPAAAARRCCG